MSALPAKLALLTCLLVPLAAYGQERIFIASMGQGPVADWSGNIRYQPPWGNILVRLAFVNPERKLGPELWLMHQLSAGTYTGYEIGVVGMNKHFILSILGGPFVSAPLGHRDLGWSWNGGVSIGFGYMPATAIGIGLSARGHRHGIGFAFDFIVRPRWTGDVE